MLTDTRSESEETMEKKTEARVSLGFAEALTILLVALKLCGVIAWSWLWVLSPLWISAGIVVTIGLVVFLLSKRW